MSWPTNPKDVFKAPKFDWARYLQLHLVHPGVRVADLHPIFGLRLASLFIELTNARLAATTPGYGLFEVTSGVRPTAEQIYLYNKICHQEDRCSMVANPYGGGASDSEGVRRFGSNHQPQVQNALWSAAWGRNHITNPVTLGYAVDVRNNGTSWSELHNRLVRHGLSWPLKGTPGSPYEPWHIEAFPRSTGWVPGPWPRRPGIHRPLFVGLNGGDVGRLQRQLGLRRDGDFGLVTTQTVRHWQRQLNRAVVKKRLLPVDGVWKPRDQRVFERAQTKGVADDIRRRVADRP